MIPTRDTYDAVFEMRLANGTEHEEHLPVEAWNEDGEALVLGHKGDLIIARSRSGFIGIERRPQIVAVIPGGGYTLGSTFEGVEYTAPVLVWTVDDRGWAKPIVATDEGWDEEARIDLGDGVRLIPPKEPYDSRQSSKDFSDWECGDGESPQPSRDRRSPA